MSITLQTPIEKLGTVGARTKKYLRKLDLDCVNDLLEYYPSRYQDFSQVVPLNQVKIGQEVTIKGRVFSAENKKTPRKFINITEAWVGDGTSFIKAVWFNQPFLVKVLKESDIALAGKITQDSRTGEAVMVSPVYETVSQDLTHTGRIVPIYPLTQGVSQKQIRYLIKSSLEAASEIAEFLPEEILKKNNFLTRSQSVRVVHFPPNEKFLETARKRLKFEELFIIQLSSQRRAQFLKQEKARPCTANLEKIDGIISRLPFTLTKAQEKALKEIREDMESASPMNRLLEGDVGSGKTVVASLSMAVSALNGYQSALMAPTEILANQHYLNLKNLLGDDFEIALLTRTQCLTSAKGKISKKTCKTLLSHGKIPIVIGTQALLTEDFTFLKLALAVIDEQHRFGVSQRKMLRQKSLNPDISPHLLSLTATPIPRSLALTVYGDLELSLLDEKPKDRQKIVTKLVPEHERNSAFEFVKKQVAFGDQAFIVCPLIEESDALGVKAATIEFEFLKKDVFKNESAGLLHGRMKAGEKRKAMEDFQNGLIDILITTPVVEVGVDVPNAAIMIIEGAQRFGLAQLHQFRGRVGRSGKPSYCFLFADTEDRLSLERLSYMVNHDNGFELAEYDLKTRGPGEVYGARQSGFLPSLKIADLRDHNAIKHAREEARLMLQKSPDLGLFKDLKERLDLWERDQHWE